MNCSWDIFTEKSEKKETGGTWILRSRYGNWNIIQKFHQIHKYSITLIWSKYTEWTRNHIDHNKIKGILYTHHSYLVPTFAPLRSTISCFWVAGHQIAMNTMNSKVSHMCPITTPETHYFSHLLSPTIHFWATGHSVISAFKTLQG